MLASTREWSRVECFEERNFNMIRKAMMVVGAVLALGVGMGAGVDNAEAGHKPRISIYLGSGYYGGFRPIYRVGHRHGHCHVVRVKRNGYWRRVSNCHGHRHRHPHHR
jgi:hypothetical protein